MHDKYQWYRGLKFTRDEKTGYYLNSTHHIRMHRFVWLCEKGEIPEGYDIHHIDHDPGNNDISNLELVTKSQHRKLHYEEKTDEEKQAIIDNFNNNARPKAIEWHKSEEGREWHKQHLQKMIAKGEWNKKEEYVCEVCGKHYTRIKRNHTHCFCSGACEQKYRRQHHLNDIGLTCEICGKKFIADKYRKPIPTCCSAHCRNIKRGITLREQNEPQESLANKKLF